MELKMETKNIFEALSKAQGEIKSAMKSSENPFFKSQYADIAECIETVKAPAAKNGLSLIFNFKTDFIGERPANFIKYSLNHSSGEKIESEWILMFMKDQSPQGFGASCTYYKRQLMKAVYQIPEIDDDGASQSQSQPQYKAAPKNYAPGAQQRV